MARLLCAGSWRFIPTWVIPCTLFDYTVPDTLPKGCFQKIINATSKLFCMRTWAGISYSSIPLAIHVVLRVILWHITDICVSRVVDSTIWVFIKHCMHPFPYNKTAEIVMLQWKVVAQRLAWIWIRGVVVDYCVRLCRQFTLHMSRSTFPNDSLIHMHIKDCLYPE